MMKLIAALYLFAFLSDPVSDRLKSYPAADSYVVAPDILATPVYRGEHNLCELSFERRHYSPSENKVDYDPTMSRKVILSLFDRFSPREERGWAGWGKPGEMEFTETDSGMLTTHIPYQYVTLLMYGRKVAMEGWEQKYIVAIIQWKKPECEAK